MDDAGLRAEPTTVRLARWFRASPAELFGLVLLLTGSLAFGVVLWLQAAQRPSSQVPAPSSSVLVGASMDANGVADGPAPGVDDRFGDLDASGAGTGVSPAGSVLPGDDTRVTVHVSGAVAAAGVVVLPTGGRVADAVREAGGLAADAQPDRLNLARRVTDGEQIHVPRVGEPPRPDVSGAHPGGTGVGPRTVDVNRATPTELATLPGIGPARAMAIVRHREQHGPFSRPGDLRDVPGIGEATFQSLAELVVTG